MIDFWGGNDEAITGQSRARSKHRPGELENVRVEEKARIAARWLRGGNESAHRLAADRDADIIRSDNHRISSDKLECYRSVHIVRRVTWKIFSADAKLRLLFLSRSK